jgi:hypothetical protein
MHICRRLCLATAVPPASWSLDPQTVRIQIHEFHEHTASFNNMLQRKLVKYFDLSQMLGLL